MKKLMSLLCALALAIAFAVPVSAGEIPIGYCADMACVQANPAGPNEFWQYDLSAEQWIKYLQCEC